MRFHLTRFVSSENRRKARNETFFLSNMFRIPFVRIVYSSPETSVSRKPSCELDYHFENFGVFLWK